jgi:hypothetical protein
MTIYKNAVSSALTTNANNNPGTRANSILKFGYLSAGNPFRLIGSLRDVRVYNRELKPAEVQAMYSPQTRYELFLETSPRRTGYITPVANTSGFFFATAGI